MANQEERIFKKIYTDFDKRLDQELDEEKAERRRQLLLQAPNFKLLNMMVENEKYSQELAAKLKDGGLYYLRSRKKKMSRNTWASSGERCSPIRPYGKSYLNRPVF